MQNITTYHGDNIILHHPGGKAKAVSSCNSKVPSGIIELLTLFLLGEQLQQDRNQVGGCCLHEVQAR